MNSPLIYKPETVGSVMSSNILRCHKSDTLGSILERITTNSVDTVRFIFVIDKKETLLGHIDMASLAQSNHSVRAELLMQPSRIRLHPRDDQEKAVFLAVKENVVEIPVVDNSDRLVGVVIPKTLIDIMHNEHIEDTLLTAGVRGKGSHFGRLAAQRTTIAVKTRAPWLLFGVSVGLGLGIISSFFEASLKETVALAYFIPVVAYIADSVGTQTEAIVVRALATTRIKYWNYVFKELLIGLMLGVLVGALGGVGAAFISGSVQIGIVVSLSLFMASIVAAVLASAIPILFKVKGKDPALGSGPLTTALQDVISVVIYLLIAVAIL